MATSKSKRNKAYKPRPAKGNTMDIAKRHKCALTPAEVADIIGPTRQSLEALRTGSAKDADWYNLSEAAGIGLDLADIGIFSDEQSVALFASMYAACGEIGKRFKTLGRLVAKGPELACLIDGLDHHDLQLSYCSADELKRAVDARRKQVMQAKAGQIEPIGLEREGVPA